MKYTIRDVEEKDLDRLVMLCSKHAAYEKADYHSGGKKEKLHNAFFSKNRALYCLVVETIIGYATYTFDFLTWDARRFIYLDCLYLEEE